MSNLDYLYMWDKAVEDMQVYENELYQSKMDKHLDLYTEIKKNIKICPECNKKMKSYDIGILLEVYYCNICFLKSYDLFEGEEIKQEKINKNELPF